MKVERIQVLSVIKQKENQMNTPTATYSVVNGKATITVTLINADGSETINVSKPLSKADLGNLQSQLTNQLAQMNSQITQLNNQITLTTPKMAAVTSAAADTTLV